MNNNCNDNYDRIKKKIEEERERCKYCYIQGPRGEKGERGERGPATIKVGKVETIEPTLPAEVINTGTADDVILDFKIPKGVQGIEGKIGPQGIQGIKGEKGEVGPQGAKGERGERGPVTIKVGKVETIEPTLPAEVINTGTAEDVILDFKIPKGDKGEEGEMGPRGYGIRYAMMDTQITLEQAIDTTIPLAETGVSLFTEYTNNGIKIKESGVYLISYLLCGATSEECSLTMSIKANDILQPASNPTIEFQAQIINCISGTTIISLQPDDIVTLNIKASMPVTMTFNGSTNAMLSVLKIH